MAGQIYTKEEADKLFGPVIESAYIDAVKLIALLEKTSKSVMFAIIKGEAYILGDNRVVLFPEGRTITKEEVFARADKSIVQELLKVVTGPAAGLTVDPVAVEAREGLTTVTYGDNTLEKMATCPPLC